jgi:hypothetical protein
MIADGFTHVTGRCTNCSQIVMNPFRMMIEQRTIRSRSITLAELSAAYRCRKCGGRETAGGILQPSYLGSPAETNAESPVNRLLTCGEPFSA